MTKPDFNPLAAAAAAAALLLLAACQQPAEERSAGEIVQERAQARWDALVNEEFAAAWEYYTPGFRQMSPQDAFAADMSARPVQWNAATVVSAQCQEAESKCTVLTEVTYQPGGGAEELRNVEITRDLEEQWILMDGQWWYAAN